MKLYFRKSGGFAAIFEGCQLDTTTMTPADAAELKKLVTQSNLLKQSGKKQAGARDVFLYTFDLDMDGQHNKVTFDQLSVPKEVEPLLNFLLSKSKNLMPDV